MKKAQKLLESALNRLDNLGYQLEEMGITDKVNRHNCLAFLFAEQQRIKGELDSLNARIATQKVKVDRLRQQAEKLAQNSFHSVLAPVKSTLNMIQNRLN